ncbi:MAG: fasciclin domain-containing protein [Tunicatimonas sp.]|uniref:fasciclin domain-containing protein n=1 Tax=Tunicatimonas sp. TaxID=1940096 RepID=UPI003C7908F6
MKRFSISLLAMLGFFATVFIACDPDDDGVDILPPTISDPSDTSVDPGSTVTLSFNVTTPGGFQSSSVVSSDDAVATAAVTTNLTVDEESGTLVVTVTGVAEGQSTVTLTVTDQEATSATADVVVTVNPEGTTGGGPPAVSAAVLDTIDGGSLTVLSDALEATGLFSALADADEITLLAPNNDAFTALLTELGVANLTELVTELTQDGVISVLQGHVIPDSLGAAEVIAAAGQAVGTLNPDASINITTDDDGNVFVNGAEVLTTDIQIANGIIHIIDSVINLPDLSEEITVTASAEGVGTTTWTANNTYILDGLVFVNDGQTLTIEPGTVIKGKPGQGGGASALIVARGGTIEAPGTAENPIIFTAEADDLNGSVTDDQRGLWGGVIILGNATSNNNDTNGEKNIEGIPTEDTRGVYGGTDDADDSGTFTYVSIRHGGSIIGEENEINGLTLGAVGSGTIINNIEVWANLDDGIEFFGGTVNASNLLVAYCGDDGLDTDEGYRGNVQKAIVWHTSATLRSDDPSAMELDGGVGANETVEPFSLPNFANLTLFYDEGDNDLTNAVNIRDNSGASIYNSIAINHDAPFAVERRTDIGGTAADAVGSSFERLTEGQLVISGNLFFNINGVTDPANLADAFAVQNESTADAETTLETAIADNNALVDPAFGTGATKFTPSAEAVTTELATLPEGMQMLNYKGAVDPAAASPYFANWTKTWEVISQ